MVASAGAAGSAATRAARGPAGRPLAPRLVLRVAADLLVDMDQAPRVDDEVRGVEDVASGEHLVEAVLGELVVRGAADDPAPQARCIAGIDRAA